MKAYYNSMSERRAYNEKLKEQIERLNDIQHLEIYKIVRKHTDHVTKTDTGVFVSMDTLDESTIYQIGQYIHFCNKQKASDDAIEHEKKKLEKLMKPIA